MSSLITTKPFLLKFFLFQSLLKTRLSLSPESESSFTTVELRLEKAINYLNGEDNEPNNPGDDTYSEECGPPSMKL